MAWDDLVITANWANAKARIYDNTNLNQRYFRAKRPLKIKNSNRDKQTSQPKNGAAILSHGKTNSNISTDKIEILEKALERAKKNKKKKTHKDR